MSLVLSCPICLDQFDDRSTLNGCPHEFCFVCISLWARGTNLCPLCKVRFTEITRIDAQSTSRVSTRSGKDTARIISVPDRTLEAEWDSEEIERLGLEDDEDDADEEESSADSQDDSDSRTEENKYDTTDGFVVDDGTQINNANGDYDEEDNDEDFTPSELNAEIDEDDEYEEDDSDETESETDSSDIESNSKTKTTGKSESSSSSSSSEVEIISKRTTPRRRPPSPRRSKRLKK
jgi:hypothetical protein